MKLTNRYITFNFDILYTSSIASIRQKMWALKDFAILMAIWRYHNWERPRKQGFLQNNILTPIYFRCGTVYLDIKFSIISVTEQPFLAVKYY